MSYTFKDFEEKRREYKYGDYQLSNQEESDLKKAIDNFTDKELNTTKKILKKWCGIENISNEILKEILKKDLYLANEVYCGGVADTYERENLIDAVMNHMGLEDWPINAQGDEHFKKSMNELQETAPKFGVKLKK